MGIYFILYIIEYFRKKIDKQQIIEITKNYAILAVITLVVYASNLIIYNIDDTYKQYTKFNEARSTLHDINYADYEKNKEIFDEIQWSENDHYMFYTFNFGDENIYSKENIQKIADNQVKEEKGTKRNKKPILIWNSWQYIHNNSFSKHIYI